MGEISEEEDITILQLVEKLREAGVKRFKQGDIEVEFPEAIAISAYGHPVLMPPAMMDASQKRNISYVDSDGNEVSKELMEEAIKQQQEDVLFHSSG